MAAQKVDTEFAVKQLGKLELKIDGLQLIELNLQRGFIQAHVVGHLNISGAHVICDAGFRTVIKLRPAIADLQLVVSIVIEALQLDAVENAKWRFLPIPRMVLNLLLNMSRTKLEQGLNRAVENNLANDSLGQLMQHSLKKAVPSELGLSRVHVALYQLFVQNEAITVTAAVAANLLQPKTALRVDLSYRDDQVPTAKILVDIHCTELSKILTANLDLLNEKIDVDGIGIAAIELNERNGVLWTTVQSNGLFEQMVEVGVEFDLNAENQTLQLANVMIPLTKQGLLGKALVVAFRGKIKQLILDRSPVDLAILLDQIVTTGARMLKPSVALDLRPGLVHKLRLAEGSIHLEIEGALNLSDRALTTDSRQT